MLDSATACAGLGMLAMAAASVARAGGTAAEAAEAAQACRRDLKVWFAVDTLEFLRRGGRVGGAQAWLGSTLKIKPILSIESEILPIERVRTSGRAFERLIEYLKARHDDGCDTFFIQHIHAPDQAERLVERGREIYGREPEIVSEIGPVIGAHVGPGLLGVSGMRREPAVPARLAVLQPGAVVVARARGVDALELGTGLGGERGEGPAEAAELGGHGQHSHSRTGPRDTGPAGVRG